MIIYIENQIIEYDNNKENIDKILNEIDNIIFSNSKTLSHMIIDGYEVYDDFYHYFLDNIKVIEKVEVVSLTFKELVNDILTSTLDYLERTPMLIEELANDFYKYPSQDSWNNLNDLLDGISWIMSTFISIDQDKRLKDVVSSYENWNLYAKEIFSLKDLLSDFEEALSNSDNVTIADILSYEITSMFEELANRLRALVNLEESLNDIN